MPEHDLADLERALNDGEWLRPGQVATLLETSRTSIDRWIRAGRLRYRRRGPRGDRFCHPEDVRRELAEFRHERTNGDASAG